MTERVLQHLHDLSEGQRQAAEYILQNPHKAAFMTAAALGREVGVSESTVVRLATALDYYGYPDMQRAIQQVVQDRLTSVDRLAGTVDELHGEAFSAETVMQADAENIRLTLQELSPEAFDEAVTMILEAQRIAVVGLRSASSLALFLSYWLNWVLRNVTYVGYGSGEGIEQLIAFGEQDLVIGISFPRYTRRTVELMGFARTRGVKTIAITDGLLSPLARHADVVLTAHTSMASFVDSFVAPLSLVNALICAVAVREEKRVKEALAEMEELWQKYDVYHPAMWLDARQADR